MKHINSVLYIYMGQTKAHPGACEIYRGNMPIHFLNANSKKWQGAWVYFDELQRQYREYGAEAWIQTMIGFDVFVFPRLFIPNDDSRDFLVKLFDTIRKFGGKIVYEVDDDFTNEHRHVVDGDAIAAASMADAITVTTNHLGRLMQERTGRPYHVLPNYIDPNLWNTPEGGAQKKVSHPIIGLTGSRSHENDWKIMADVFPALESQYDVSFLIMGYHPEYLAGLKMANFVPTMPYGDYSHIIKACDIIITPVDPTDKFNDSKSAIKAIEGISAHRTVKGQPAGAAVVSTNNLVYSAVIQHEKTGLLVEHTPEAWYLALERLIIDEPFRHTLQFNGYKYVWKMFDISKQWVKWERAFDSILKQSPQQPFS